MDTKKSWRDVLKIHPAADLFPLMGLDELKTLGEDIKANGLRQRIVLWSRADEEPVLLDGRNRLDAMEAVGIEFALHNGKLSDQNGPLEWRIGHIKDEIHTHTSLAPTSTGAI